MTSFYNGVIEYASLILGQAVGQFREKSGFLPPAQQFQGGVP
jgi:hypothetical protein